MMWITHLGGQITTVIMGWKMPELKWNEQEVMECLAVLPEVEDYEVSHTYSLSDNALALRITLWQYESVVQFILSRVGTQEVVSRLWLVVRDGVYYRDEKWGESLQFRDCILVPSRFYYRNIGDVFDEKLYPKGVDMELIVQPFIRLLFGRE